MNYRDAALDYHARLPHGKLAVRVTKPCETQADLSLAYTPGVAEPCREIAADPETAYRYTDKGNLVAVVTDGSAVLGLGNIGPLAAKPVMEGKGVLFKRFADIDVFDLELAAADTEAFIAHATALAPTFGGINLEDIAAPACFAIEQRLREALDIPVFHDDQHGTAIISGAALLNAAELQGKKLTDCKVVFSGAGAAAISCARLYARLGVPCANIVLVDSQGVVHSDREDLNEFKREFAVATSDRTLTEALRDADVFAGLSCGGLVSPEMIAAMAPRPIVFAMANPDPEIGYHEAMAVRDDLVMATGRSDFPNQVNNVLGFPFIFRGALDVRATAITEGMKIAATRALARIARTDGIPPAVLKAYGVDELRFGPDYIIPKPMDPRVLVEESLAVAEAATADGVARLPLTDPAAYRRHLETLAGELAAAAGRTARA